MFLGIDHTAIVVGDTDACLKFYRDSLGLRVGGGSENWGPEQERLNNVFGARLRITTLRAEALLRAARVVSLSPGVVLLADGALGFRAGLTVRDPDGHAMQFRSR